MRDGVHEAEGETGAPSGPAAAGRGARGWRPLAVFATAAGLLAVLALVRPPGPPVGIYPLAAARALAGSLAPERVLDFSPFALHLHLAAGVLPGGGTAWVRFLEGAALAASAALVFEIVAGFAPAAVAAGAAAALLLSPGPLVLSRMLVPETWVLLFTSGALWAFGRWHRRRTLPGLALVGLLLGLSWLVRPTATLVIAAAVVALLVAGERRQKAFAALLGPPLLCVLALGLRSRQLTGRFDPTTMDPGAVFYGANNPWAHGYVVDSPLLKELEGLERGEPDYAHVLYKRYPALCVGRPLTPREAGAFWAGKGLAFLSAEPGEALALLRDKLSLLLGPYDVPDSFAATREGELLAAAVPMVPFSLVAGLGLVGLAGWARRSSVGLFAALALAAQVAGVGVYYAGARLRLPLEPFLLAGAAALIVEVTGLAREGRRWAALSAVGLALAVTVVLSIPSEAAERHRHAWGARSRASLLRAEAAAQRARGEREAAAGTVVKALVEAPLDLDELVLANLPYGPEGPLGRAAVAVEERLRSGPVSPDEAFDAALLLAAAGRTALAGTLLTDLDASGSVHDRLGATPPVPAYHLARLALAGGNVAEAASRLARATALRPSDPPSLALLAALQRRAGRPDEARRIEERLLRVVPELDAASLLGDASLLAGDAAGARLRLREVGGAVPRVPSVAFAEARAAAASGDPGAAVGFAERGFASREEPIPAGPELIRAYRGAAEASPGSAEALVRLGRVLRRYGRFAEARAVLGRALALDPAGEAARWELDRLALVEAGSKEDGR